MSEINVRLASQSDCKDLVDLLQWKELEPALGSIRETYTNQSIQNLLSNSCSKVFVAEKEGKLVAVMTTSVVDAGTTLVIKDVHIEEENKDSNLESVLLTWMYNYMRTSFRRLKRERFVSSRESLTKLFDKSIDKLRTSHTTPGKFSKVFQLDQQEIEVEASKADFGRKLDSLVREFRLVHMTKKEADLYILRNISCFSGHTLIVDSVPYIAQLSNTDTIFNNGDYLMGEKQSDHRDRNGNSSLRVPSPSGTASGRNSPASRLQYSHLVNALDSLHTSLQSMTGTLQGLHDSLRDAMPKSFSHGKQLKTQRRRIWEATVYTEDSDVFRAHALEQLRAATLQLKTDFTFVMSCNSAMSNEAQSLFTEELGLQLTAGHERKTVVVYERPFELSLRNGFTAS